MHKEQCLPWGTITATSAAVSSHPLPCGPDTMPTRLFEVNLTRVTMRLGHSFFRNVRPTSRRRPAPRNSTKQCASLQCSCQWVGESLGVSSTPALTDPELETPRTVTAQKFPSFLFSFFPKCQAPGTMITMLRRRCVSLSPGSFRSLELDSKSADVFAVVLFASHLTRGFHKSPHRAERHEYEPFLSAGFWLLIYKSTTQHYKRIIAPFDCEPSPFVFNLKDIMSIFLHFVAIHKQ